MSEVLERTWTYLTSSVSGPRWTLPSNQASPTAHLPHGLALFIQAMFEAPGKGQQNDIAQQQIQILQTKFKEASIKTPALANYVTRALVCHLAGYDVKFAHFYALELAEKGSVLEKKLGYLAFTFFMEESDDLSLLLVNTLTRDLRSSNPLEVNMALVVVAHLFKVEVMAMLLPVIVEKLSHSQHFVRKKALACLHQMVRHNRGIVHQIERYALAAVGDRDPGVVGVAIQLVTANVDAVPADHLDSHSECYRSLLESLFSVQDQILDHRLPSDLIYHGVPGPWIMMDILKLIGVLQRRDALPVDLMPRAVDLVLKTMQMTKGPEGVRKAILFECIATLATFQDKCDGSQQIGKKVMSKICKFLRSEHTNGIYVGLCALDVWVANRSAPLDLSPEEEQYVLACLDSGDDLLMRKTLPLIHVVANEKNVASVVNRLMENIKTRTDGTSNNDDSYFKNLLIDRVIWLADKLSPSFDFYIFLLLRLLQNCDPDKQEELLLKMRQKLYEKKNEEVGLQVGGKLKRLLLKLQTEMSNVPEPLLKLYLYTESQFCEPELLHSVQRIVDIGRHHMSLCQGIGILEMCLHALFCLTTESMLNKPGPLQKAVVDQVESLCCDIQAQDRLDSDFFSSDERANLILILQEELIRIVHLPEQPHLSQLSSTTPDLCDELTLSFADFLIVDHLQSGSAPHVPWNPGLTLRHNVSLPSTSPDTSLTPYHLKREGHPALQLNLSRSHNAAAEGEAALSKTGDIEPEDDDEIIFRELSQWQTTN